MTKAKVSVKGFRRFGSNISKTPAKIPLIKRCAKYSAFAITSRVSLKRDVGYASGLTNP